MEKLLFLPSVEKDCKMSKKLNFFEEYILWEIVDFNSKKYPLLKYHIPLLRVKKIEKTGVGMYINFEYVSFSPELTLKDDILSSNKSLIIDTLNYELNYELNIDNGKVNFLELVTNGEDWIGNYNSYKFIS